MSEPSAAPSESREQRAYKCYYDSQCQTSGEIVKMLEEFGKQEAEAAERDTLEQCALLVVQFTKDWRPCTCGEDDSKWKAKNARKMYKTQSGHAIDCTMYHAFELAERIRGKE